MLSYFCDASHQDSIGQSAYAVVKDSFCPGSSTHNKRIGTAWQLPVREYNNSNLAEAYGVLQGYRQALVDIGDLVQATPPDERKNLIIIVMMFSDSQNTIEPFLTGVFPEQATACKVVFGEVLTQIELASHDLATNPYGIDVSNELHWLKGHTEKVEAHTLADKMAKKAVRSGSYVLVDGSAAIDSVMEPGVASEIGGNLDHLWWSSRQRLRGFNRDPIDETVVPRRNTSPSRSSRSRSPPRSPPRPRRRSPPTPRRRSRSRSRRRSRSERTSRYSPSPEGTSPANDNGDAPVAPILGEHRLDPQEAFLKAVAVYYNATVFGADLPDYPYVVIRNGGQDAWQVSVYHLEVFLQMSEDHGESDVMI